jgi:hypothetical protein
VLYVMEELAQCVMREIVRFGPTAEIDVGGAQHIGGGTLHPSG